MITTTHEAKQAWLEGRREEVRNWCYTEGSTGMGAFDFGEDDVSGAASRVAGVALELGKPVDEKDLESVCEALRAHFAFLRYIEGKA